VVVNDEVDEMEKSIEIGFLRKTARAANTAMAWRKHIVIYAYGTGRSTDGRIDGRSATRNGVAYDRAV